MLPIVGIKSDLTYKTIILCLMCGLKSLGQKLLQAGTYVYIAISIKS